MVEPSVGTGIRSSLGRTSKSRGATIRSCAAAAALATVLSTTLEAQVGPCAHEPLYARKAAHLNNGSLRSPDGRKNLTVKTIRELDGSSLQFTVHVGTEEYVASLKGFKAEVVWAPDSSAFGVTETEGGGGFDIRAYLFSVSDDGLRVADISPIIERALDIQGKCEIPVRPNIAIVDWLGSARRVLVAGEVVPVSVCRCAGSYKLYELDATELKIIRSYTQREASDIFPRSLGCELRKAVGRCGSE